MKTFILLFAFLSAIAHAAGNVPRCLKTKKLKDDGRYLIRDEALCDAPFALGISNDGTFALWKDEAIVQVFATDANTLHVTEVNDEAYVSVENADGSLIW